MVFILDNKISKRDLVFAGVNIVQVPSMAHWQVSNLLVKAIFFRFLRWLLNRSCSYRAVFTQKKRGICVWICTRGFTTKLSLSSGFHHNSAENGHLCGCSFSFPFIPQPLTHKHLPACIPWLKMWWGISQQGLPNPRQAPTRMLRVFRKQKSTNKVICNILS